MERSLSRGATAYLLVAIVIAAFNLRPALVTVGPVLPEIGRALQLPPPSLGLLTALPILTLGIGSGLADPLGRRIGWSRGVLVASVLIALGIVARSAGNATTIYLGAIVAGFGIGLGGVYVPALVKANFTQLGVLVGVYSMMLTLGSLVSVALVPTLLLTFGGDWRRPLAVWALPALLSALAWLPLHAREGGARARRASVSLWRNRLAWIVALYMGLQSSLFYSLAAWLAAMLQARGVSLAGSGISLAWFFGPQLVGALLAPVVVARVRRQGLVALSLAALGGVTAALALRGPLALVNVSCGVLGICLGGVFGVALAYLVLRARHPETAASLSSMAQTVGYIVASLGPLALGALRALPKADLTSLAFLLLLTVLTMVFGLLAGRPVFVDDAGTRNG